MNHVLGQSMWVRQVFPTFIIDKNPPPWNIHTLFTHWWGKYCFIWDLWQWLYQTYDQWKPQQLTEFCPFLSVLGLCCTVGGEKGPNTIPFSAKYWKAYIIFRRECHLDARWPQKPKGGMRKSHHHDFMMMMMSWLFLRGKNMDFLRLDSMTDEKWMADRHKI